MRAGERDRASQQPHAVVGELLFAGRPGGARGAIPADAPLPHTPARNLPPPEPRDSPHDVLSRIATRARRPTAGRCGGVAEAVTSDR
jgi:hypothetical protein